MKQEEEIFEDLLIKVVLDKLLIEDVGHLQNTDDVIEYCCQEVSQYREFTSEERSRFKADLLAASKLDKI